MLENGISTAIRIHAPRANGWDLVWAQGDLGALRVPISHRGAPRPPEQGRCALDRDRGRNAHRAGLCAAARGGAGRLRGGAAKWPRERSATFGSRSQPRHGPALHSTARGHLAQGKTVAVFARARRTPQSPPLRHTSTAISPNCQEQLQRLPARDELRSGGSRASAVRLLALTEWRRGQESLD